MRLTWSRLEWWRIGSIDRLTIEESLVGSLRRPRLYWEDCVKEDGGRIQPEVP